MATASDFIAHSIAPGIDLMARHDVDEDLVYDVVRQCKIVMLDRDAARARIKECIAQLAQIDRDCGGDDDGLAIVSESMGWTSNFSSHTTDNYERVLTAIVDVLDDEDLVDTLETCEFQIKRKVQP